ncbi:S8 family serine peptidase [candidate division WOR-3 bacterium]|nr:S8 family serine peptidase [candidate division WOR-3 bacterium]
MSTHNSPEWVLNCGTSFAAPHVTGLAGLLLDLNPSMEPADLTWIMKLSARDITKSPASSGWDEWTGYGCIDAEKACKWVIPPYYLHRTSSGGYTVFQPLGHDLKIEFTRPPHPDTITYGADKYKCDVYELRYGTYKPSFQNPPVAWGNAVGYSKSLDDETNDATEYLGRQHSGGGVELKTYFYKLKKKKQLIGWKTLDPPVWAPYNPHDYEPWESTVVCKQTYPYVDGGNGFEDSDVPSYINMPWSWIATSRDGVRFPVARRVKASDEGVAGHTGSYVFKFSGLDANESSQPTWGDWLDRKIIDVDRAFAEGPLYVKARLYAAECPEYKVAPNEWIDVGRFCLEGKSAKASEPDGWLSRLFDDNYGYCVDRFGTRMMASYMNFPEDEWTDMIFNISPASGAELEDLVMVYADSVPGEGGLPILPGWPGGEFTCYLDDLEILDHYPNPNEWHVKVAGADTNGTTTWQMQGGDTYQNGTQIDLVVEGNGLADGETEGQLPLNPSVGIDLDPKPQIGPSSYLYWEQYDKAKALVLALRVSEEPEGRDVWLYYAANAPELWSQQGYVDMSPHTELYDAWESITTNVVQDYIDEYTSPPGLISLYVHEVRLEHIARREWDGDHGGSIRNVSLIPSGGSIPLLTGLTVNSPNGLELWHVGYVELVMFSYVGSNPEVEGFRVEYCTDFGTGNTWIPIRYLVNSGMLGYYFFWTVPNTPSTTCRVRVVAMKSENGILVPLGCDISDGNFTIFQGMFCAAVASLDPVKPLPENQIAGFSSQSLNKGDELELKWIAGGINPVTSVSLFYSTDEGKSFKTIATDLEPGREVIIDSTQIDDETTYTTALGGSYTWTVPEALSPNTVFRYVAYDNTGDSAQFTYPDLRKDSQEPEIAEEPVVVPTEFSLECLPLGSFGGARILLGMPVAQHVNLKVYDVTGREIKTLISGEKPAGLHEILWEGCDDAGRSVSAGVYFVRMETGKFQSNKKVTLLR